MTILKPRTNLGEINRLLVEIAKIKRENEHLKADNKRLGGDNSGPGMQMRRCVNCSRDLPDGPDFFPGYLQPMGKDSAAEAARHHCFYCQ